jgi:hypothetical protein
MSTTVAVERKSIPQQSVITDRKTVTPRKKPPKIRKHAWIRTKLYNQVLETVKSILLVFAFLSIYMLTGLHEWWMHFVDKLW